MKRILLWIAPLIGILMALTTLVFFILFALFIYIFVDEDYRRHGSENLRPGEDVVWQQFHGYPFDWEALASAVLTSSPLIVPTLLALCFVIRLLYLMIRFSFTTHRFRLSYWRYFDFLLGVLFAFASAYVAFFIRFLDQPWLNLLGYVSLLTFILIPLWLMFTIYERK